MKPGIWARMSADFSSPRGQCSSQCLPWLSPAGGCSCSLGWCKAKLKPIKTATNEDSLSFLLALLSEENGAIKKAFYLSAIKEPTIASGRFPPKAGEQSCRWAMSLMGWAAEDAGAGEGGLQVHGLMPSWAQPEGRCFWGNGPISTHKTRQVPRKNT